MSLFSWLGGLLGGNKTQTSTQPTTPIQVPTPAPVPQPVIQPPEPEKPVEQKPEAANVAKTSTFLVTADQLATIMPVGAKKGVDYDAFAAAINKVFAIPAVSIKTNKEAALFVSESAYESSEYTRLREIWNPAQVPFQKNYEGSKTLGNTEPGDGFKFRGGGLPQLTGRWNYTAFSKWSGVDFVNNPDQIAQVYYATLAFGWYWSFKKLSQYAFTKTINDEVRAINGPGMLGLAGRQKYYDLACQVFEVEW